MTNPVQLGFDGAAHDPADRPARATTRRETFQEREARLLAAGFHPSGIGTLATGRDEGAGETCRTCSWCVVRGGVAGTYHKCGLQRATWTGGRAKDILVRWPACKKWSAKGR